MNANSVLASIGIAQGHSSRCELSLSDSLVLPDALVLERPSRMLATVSVSYYRGCMRCSSHGCPSVFRGVDRLAAEATDHSLVKIL